MAPKSYDQGAYSTQQANYGGAQAYGKTGSQTGASVANAAVQGTAAKPKTSDPLAAFGSAAQMWGQQLSGYMNPQPQAQPQAGGYSMGQTAAPQQMAGDYAPVQQQLSSYMGAGQPLSGKYSAVTQKFAGRGGFDFGGVSQPIEPVTGPYFPPEKPPQVLPQQPDPQRPPRPTFMATTTDAGTGLPPGVPEGAVDDGSGNYLWKDDKGQKWMYDAKTGKTTLVSGRTDAPRPGPGSDNPTWAVGGDITQEIVDTANRYRAVPGYEDVTPQDVLNYRGWALGTNGMGQKVDFAKWWANGRPLYGSTNYTPPEEVAGRQTRGRRDPTIEDFQYYSTHKMPNGMTAADRGLTFDQWWAANGYGAY